MISKGVNQTMGILTNFYLWVAVVTVVSIGLFVLRRILMKNPFDNIGVAIIEIIICNIILISLICVLYLMLPNMMILLLVGLFLLNGIVVNLRFRDALRVIAISIGAIIGLIPYGTKRIEKMHEGAKATVEFINTIEENATGKKNSTDVQTDSTDSNNEEQSTEIEQHQP